jgi:hypothetical protein
MMVIFVSVFAAFGLAAKVHIEHFIMKLGQRLS